MPIAPIPCTLRAQVKEQECEYLLLKVKISMAKIEFFESRDLAHTKLQEAEKAAREREEEAREMRTWYQKQYKKDMEAEEKRISQLQATNDKLRETLHKWGKRKHNVGWVPVCSECAKKNCNLENKCIYVHALYSHQRISIPRTQNVTRI